MSQSDLLPTARPLLAPVTKNSSEIFSSGPTMDNGNTDIIQIVSHKSYIKSNHSHLVTMAIVGPGLLAQAQVPQDDRLSAGRGIMNNEQLKMHNA